MLCYYYEVLTIYKAAGTIKMAEEKELKNFRKLFQKRPFPKNLENVYKVYSYFENKKGEDITYKEISDSLDLKLSSVKNSISHLLNNNLISKKFKLGRTPVFLSKCDSSNKCSFIWGKEDMFLTCQEEKYKILTKASMYHFKDSKTNNTIKELYEMDVTSKKFLESYNFLYDKLIEVGVKNIFKLELKCIAHRFRIQN